MRARFPHVLSQEQKQRGVNDCNELLIHFGQDSSQRLTAITNEKWIFCRQLQSTHMWSWIDASGDRLQVGRRTISDRKFTGYVVNGSFSHVKFLHVTFSNSYLYALFARAFCSLFLKAC